jgi:hypothetical protein
MRPLRVSLWCCALAALAVGNGSAAAAWNNVFQVCCHSCRSSNYVAAPAPTAAAYAAPAPCGGCQQCTTNYVQRCYYQPVVTYQKSCYQEPVTTYRTSYYYEPCTSVRYSCYYDPCSCSYQQVAQPVTTYRLRSQCCPVTSYLQRCCLKPVTTYQQMTYYEPQTTCCTTTIGAPVAAPPAGAAVAVPQQPGVQAGALPSQPGVQGGAIPQQPGVQGGAIPQQPGVSAGALGAPPAAAGQPYSPPPAVNATPEPPAQADQTSNSNRFPWLSPARQGATAPKPQLQAPVPVQPAAPTPRPRYDRITSIPRANNAEGQVLRSDRRPQARMKVVFFRADEQAGRQTVTTDDAGRFQTTLAAGNWLVYTQDATGRLTYQQKMSIEKDKPTIPITLVSR